MIYTVLAFMLLQLVCCQDFIITIAGSTSVGYSGDNGQATSAGFYYPTGVALDASGRILLSPSAALLHSNSCTSCSYS